MEFNTPDTVAEFRDMFAEGKVNIVNIFRKRNPFVDQELAEQSEILETVGDQDPSQFYYGQVTFISTVTPLCKEQLSFMSIHVYVHPRSLYFGQLTQPIDINVQGADGEA